jgi:hypothetical protein
MIEIDIPLETVDVLYTHVINNLGNRTLGEFPFYTKVNSDLLETAFKELLNLNTVSTAYIYAHDETIPLHVDRYNSEAIYNLNVPIYVLDPQQKFIVFDQEFDKSGCEWQVNDVKQKRHTSLLESDLVSSKKDNDHIESICYTDRRPCDTVGVNYLTDQPVNESIKDDLPFVHNFYHGLTGSSWVQTPGKGLIFKSSQLHGTGIQTKFKIGCVLMLKSKDCLLNQ